MGLTSEKHFQHSCEVYRRSDGVRHTVYGRTREEIMGNEHFIAKLFRQAPCPLDGRDRDDLLLWLEDDWQDDVVVTATRTIAMGLGKRWARVPRRFDEYGERV